MRTYIKISILITVLTLYSCEGFLDTYPSDMAVASTAMMTLTDANNACNGMYNSMKWNDYYGTQMPLMGDSRGDDLQPKRLDARMGWVAIYNYDFSAETNSYFGMWNKLYKVIMYANAILEGWDAIPAVTAAEIADKNNVKGQALAIRAFCYFDLARLYGYPYMKDNGASLGASIITQTYSNPAEAKVPRATVAETYTQISRDIADALPLLTKSKTAGKINYWGAKLLQARVHLYKGEWENAYNAAKEVITDSPYTLATNAEYVDYWSTEGASETILELLVTKVSNIDDDGGVVSWFFSLWHKSDATGDLVPSQGWIDLVEADPGDVRNQLIRYDSDKGAATGWLAKYPGTNKDDFKVNNPRLMRLSEAYLIAAEAGLKSSKSDAVDFLNTIRRRANPAIALLTAVTEDNVLTERRKEFIAEGHRFFDLTRLGKNIDRSGGYHFGHTAGTGIGQIIDVSTEHRIVLPMSASQRILWGEDILKQNPGY